MLGLLVAVAVGIAAAALTSQQIGLSSEPIRADEALAPKSDGDSGRDRHGDDHDGDDSAAPTGTTTTSIPEATSTSDDSDDDDDDD